MSLVGKRGAERRACDIRGEIVLRGKAAPIECKITDISASGVRLRFPQPLELPQRFILNIPARSESRSVILRWLSDNEAGLQFSTNASQLDEDILDIIERIEALEAQEPRSSKSQPVLAEGADEGALNPCGDGFGLTDLRNRIDDVESVSADALAELEKQFAKRLSALEASSKGGTQKPSSDSSYSVLVERIQSKFQDVNNTINALNGRLSSLEAAAPALHSPPVPESPLYQSIDPAQFDKRFSGIERQLQLLMQPHTHDEPSHTHDEPSVSVRDTVQELENRIDRVSTRLESALLTRDQAVAEHHVAGEALLTPDRRPESEGCESDADPIESKRDSQGLEGIAERMSNIEVEMLAVKYGRPAMDNPEYDARLRRLENNTEEVRCALKEVLSYLMRLDHRNAG